MKLLSQACRIVVLAFAASILASPVRGASVVALHAVSGCVLDVGSTTRECARGGGDLLLITGHGFSVGSPEVSVAGASCGAIEILSDTQLTCVLPPGVGRAGVTVSVLGETSNTVDLFYQGIPTAATNSLRLFSGAAVNPVLLTSTLGGDLIAIDGHNLAPLGTEGVELWIGDRPCERQSTCPNGNLCDDAPDCGGDPCGFGNDLLVCATPPGAGILTPEIRYFDTSVSYDDRFALVEKVSYPAPAIDDNSFRLFPSQGDPGVPSVTALCNDASSDILFFDGVNFGPDPQELRVLLGTIPCMVDFEQTSDTQVACRPAARAGAPSPNPDDPYTSWYEGPFPISLTVNDLTASSPVDAFRFGMGPGLVSIHGCVDDGVTTRDCPITGGIDLTVEGSGFPPDQRIMLRLGKTEVPCVPDPSAPTTRARCPLQPGRGTVAARVAFGCVESPYLTVSYARAAVEAVSGCVDDGNATSACVRFGGDLITITGTGFGMDGALVLVGDQLCADITHDPLTPELKLTCIAPPGSGQRQVRVIAKGDVASGAAGVLSYLPCPAGTYEADGSCLDCSPGTFSAAPGQRACDPCPAGTFAAIAGASVCQSCVAGTFSSAGASECSECAAGHYADEAGASRCLPCSPGSFRATPGAASCSNCPEGSYADQPGALHCTPCPAGMYQSTAGGSRCESCSPGTYQPAAGSAGCMECVVGTAQPNSGQASCLPCLEDSVGPGAVSCADRMKCRRVRDQKNPKFVPQPGIQLDDLFAAEDATLRAPVLVCSPADGNSEGVVDPDAYTCCYQAKGSGRSTAHEFVDTSDALGSLALKVGKKTALVCLPCSVEPQP